MSGEVAFFGIFVPSLLVLALAALLVTMLLTRLVSFLGLYRFVAYRALVDVCLFVLLLGLFARFSFLVGLP
jgi:Protein of unknown function (DUF1656)